MQWFLRRASVYDREGLTLSAAGFAIWREAQELARACEDYRRELEAAHRRPISLDELLGQHRAEVVRVRSSLLPAFDSWGNLADKHARAGGTSAPIARVAANVAAKYYRADREAVKVKMKRLLEEARAYEYTGWDYEPGQPVRKRSKPLPPAGASRTT